MPHPLDFLDRPVDTLTPVELATAEDFWRNRLAASGGRAAGHILSRIREIDDEAGRRADVACAIAGLDSAAAAFVHNSKIKTQEYTARPYAADIAIAAGIAAVALVSAALL